MDNKFTEWYGEKHRILLTTLAESIINEIGTEAFNHLVDEAALKAGLPEPDFPVACYPYCSPLCKLWMAGGRCPHVCA